MTDRVTCPHCGREDIEVDVPCPGCNATTFASKHDAELGLAGELAEIRAHMAWGANELTLVGIVYAAVVALLAVVIPLSTWWARLAFGLCALAFLVAIGVWKEHVIAVARRYLSWKGPGRRIK